MHHLDAYDISKMGHTKLTCRFKTFLKPGVSPCFRILLQPGFEPILKGLSSRCIKGFVNRGCRASASPGPRSYWPDISTLVEIYVKIKNITDYIIHFNGPFGCTRTCLKRGCCRRRAPMHFIW